MSTPPSFKKLKRKHSILLAHRPRKSCEVTERFKCGEQVTLFTELTTVLFGHQGGERSGTMQRVAGRAAGHQPNKTCLSCRQQHSVFCSQRPVGGGVAFSLALTSIPSSFSIPLCYSRVFEREHHPAPSNKNLFCLKLSGSSSCCFVLERDCTPDAHSFSPVQAFLWSRSFPLHQLLNVTKYRTPIGLALSAHLLSLSTLELQPSPRKKPRISL